MKQKNMKYEVSQKTFNSELQHEFKAKKYDSCGRPKFELDIKWLKEYLETEYKVSFNITDEKDDEYENGTLEEEILYLENRLKDLFKKKIEKEQKATQKDNKQVDEPEEEPKKYFAKFPVTKPTNNDEKSFSMFSFVYHKKNQDKKFHDKNEIEYVAKKCKTKLHDHYKDSYLKYDIER
jgi:hypothetical protein